MDGFLIYSSLLVSLLLGSHVDSSRQNIDCAIEVRNLSLLLVDSILDSVLGVRVLFNPVLVGSSLEFSRLRNLSDDILTKLDDFLDSRLVRLDSWSLSNLSEKTENRIPRLLRVLVLLDVVADMGRNLRKYGSDLRNLKQTRSSFQSISDDALRLFDGVLSSIVLILNIGPFLVLQVLVGIQLLNFLVVKLDKSEFSISLGDSLISSWDLDVELLVQLSNSILSLSDLIIEFSEFLVTLVLQVEDEFVILSLLLLQLVLHVSQKLDQVRDWISGVHLQLESIEECFSEFRAFHLLDDIHGLSLSHI